MMRRARVLIVLLLVAAAFAAWRFTHRDTLAESPPPRLSLAAALGGDSAGFEHATAPHTWKFPEDHGAHPAFRTEWWYITGNVESDGGRRFGYQLTFFRRALTDSMPARASAWAAQQAWMAHLALTDAGDGRFLSDERFARGALNLAGATAAPFRVWLGPWSIESVHDAATVARNADARGILPMRLNATADSFALTLELTSSKPFVLHGERGLSRKGPEPGNASQYGSFTRLSTTGRIRIGTDSFDVRGLSWLDREWSTSALSPGVEGWDWFALQFNDGTELMFYRLRRTDGSTDRFSAGTFVDAAGNTTPIAHGDVELDARDTWTSASGTRYPIEWRMRVPSLQLDVEIDAILSSQEMSVSVRYWEGAVDVRGMRGGRQISGRGFMELTGYADSPDDAAGRGASLPAAR